MTKEWKKKDYYHILLLIIINLLLISPILTKQLDIGEELEKFELQLFYSLTLSKPNENLIVTPLSLATLLILLRMSAAPHVVAEIDRAFGLYGRSNDIITQKYKDLLQKYQRQHLFIMTNKISVISRNKVIDVIEMNANETVDDWPISTCIKVAELSFTGQPTELMLATETHFKNILLRYSVFSIAKGPFYTIDDDIINADMIQIVGKLNYGQIPELSSRIVEVPYSDGDTSLVMLLPYKNDGVKILQKDLRAYTLSDVMSYTKKQFVKVQVPKLITTVDMSLDEELKSMGMTSMFQHLCDTPLSIRVSDVNYRARFLVNDKSAKEDPYLGSNASFIEDYEHFHADHPFIYMIKSSKNMVYLIGKFLK